MDGMIRGEDLGCTSIHFSSPRLGRGNLQKDSVLSSGKKRVSGHLSFNPLILFF
jgi:hypothetical protein